MKLWPFRRPKASPEADSAAMDTAQAPDRPAPAVPTPAAATGLSALLAAAVAADEAPPASRWIALPGGRLELGSTGFQIRLETDSRLVPYFGCDPEGRLLAYGHNLESLKQALEQHAAWRDEFTLPEHRRPS